MINLSNWKPYLLQLLAHNINNIQLWPDISSVLEQYIYM